MNKDPITHLLQEHKAIMAQVDDLREAVEQLTRHGESALPKTLPVFHQISQMMAGQLDLHRRKEDDVFFPAVEAFIGMHGPTDVMRQEHRDIHAQGVLLRETLRELNKEQHPAIEAGAEKLRELVANGSNAEALRRTGEEIIYLLDAHFAKEENILFPIVRELLDATVLNDISRQFEAMEIAATSAKASQVEIQSP